MADRGERVTVRTILADPPVRAVIAIVFLVQLGFGIIIPILPLFARSFHVGYGEASLLISSFAFARLVFDLVAGPMVERFGERAVATTGAVVIAVTSLLTALAPTFALAVVFRGGSGAGSSIMFAAMYSYLLKVVPPERFARMLSLFYVMLNIGVIAGGPIGGLIGGKLGLASPLYFYAAVSLVSGFLYIRYMPDPNTRLTPARARAAAAPSRSTSADTSALVVA
jgi:MFS family permease